MFHYIKGKVTYVGSEFIVLDQHGIGFQIITPNPFVFTKHKDQEITVYVHQYVREDVISLYGFQTVEEKFMFQKLLNVSGIGPKGALAILAYGNPNEVIYAIENEDEKFLMKFPGVGKKTARQMILDLKGKLDDVLTTMEVAISTEKISPVENHKDQDVQLEEAILALLALGYSERELKAIKPKLSGKGLTTDQYIKEALKLLFK